MNNTAKPQSALNFPYNTTKSLKEKTTLLGSLSENGDNLMDIFDDLTSNMGLIGTEKAKLLRSFEKSGIIDPREHVKKIIVANIHSSARAQNRIGLNKDFEDAHPDTEISSKVAVISEVLGLETQHQIRFNQLMKQEETENVWGLIGNIVARATRSEFTPLCPPSTTPLYGAKEL